MARHQPHLAAALLVMLLAAACSASGHGGVGRGRPAHAARPLAAAADGRRLQAAAAAAPAGSEQQRERAPVRVYIDESFFLPGDTEILRAYISRSRGRLVLSGEAGGGFVSFKGYFSPDAWDLYWTIRAPAHKAYRHMRPGQLVNALPGANALALKRRFVETFQQAYGEAAFGAIPRSYLLPQQYWLWRSHLAAAASPPEAKWVLKADQHRGKGVAVVPQREALALALAHAHAVPGRGGGDGTGGDGDDVRYRHILVQQYLRDQLVVGGRSSYLRVWLVLTGVAPMRAYLFRGGFAIFGKEAKAAGSGGGNSSSSGSSSSGGGSGGSSGSSGGDSGLIVNLWVQDRHASPIWGLEQLEQHLAAHPELVEPLPAGDSSGGSSGSSTNASEGAPPPPQQEQGRRRTFADAWGDMRASAALALAAGLPAIRAAANASGAPRQGTFEYFGLDFVLDRHLRPWLLEVNAIPSLARINRTGCAGRKAAGECELVSDGRGNRKPGGGGGGGSGSSNSSGSGGGDAFDLQKEAFVHDMLQLLGLPVDDDEADGEGGSGGSGEAAAGKAGLALLREAAAAAAGAERLAGAADGGRGERRRRQRRQLLRARVRDRLRRALLAVSDEADALPPADADAAADADADAGAPHVGKRHQHRDTSNQGEDHATNTTGAAAEAEKQQQQAVLEAGGIVIAWEGAPPPLSALPPRVRALLCGAAQQQDDPGGGGGGDAFACVKCLTAADLAAVAAAEAELLRAGRFEPVHDFIAAHALSRRAAAASAAAAAAAAPADAAVDGDDNATAAAAGERLTGAEYLSPEPGVWRRLYGAWLALSRRGAGAGGGVGLGDLGVMRWFTSRADVPPPAAPLALRRADWVGSAWLRARRAVPEAACGAVAAGAGAAGGASDASGSEQRGRECVIARLERLVADCHVE